jgi:phosphoribosylformylglycinamidine synthase
VSGNGSRYNETNGKGILPTPSIGGVGLIDNFEQSASIAFKHEGEAILVVGETTGWLGQSMYLRELCAREEGAPPPVDLTEERENGEFVRGLILDGTASAVHDVSDGGLLVAIAEMAMAAHIGAVLESSPDDVPAHAFWFGEDQARYVVTVPAAQIDAVIARVEAAAAPVRRLGITGGDALMLPGERPMLVANLRERFESWLPAYMAGGD